MIDLSEVGFDRGRLPCTVVKLAQHDVRRKIIEPASAKPALTADSRAIRAMTLFVSRRKLPGSRIDSFASFLNRLGHQAQVIGVNETSEIEQIPTWNPASAPRR